MKLIPEVLAEAVEDCEVCGGSGWWERMAPAINAVPCMRCHGRGKMLSGEGRELVEFLARFMEPKFAEADHFHDREHGV